MGNPIGALAVRLHQALVEPVLVLALRRGRLARFGPEALEREALPVNWRRTEACRAPCPLQPEHTPKLLRRYARGIPGVDRNASLRQLTPMIIPLSDLPNTAAFDALLKQRSARTLSKIRAAERQGYHARQFMLAAHVADMHAIRTSMAFRAAGPVFDRWFLKPHHIAEPASAPLPVAAPCCPVHWTVWWGIFLAAPGYTQNGVPVDERLVAYVKVMRIGDVVHYTEIMGHRDHLGANVMLQLHRAIAHWLIEGREPAAQGAHVLLYGAAEHGGAGLLTWKKRAGFRPGWLRVTDDR